MRYLPLAGRILFTVIFLFGAPGHFTATYAGYAAQAGVPPPGVLVPIAGVIALAGALSVLLGYRAKQGAWLLVVFLIPVTLYMHKFWGLTDPMMVQMQQAHFLKNVGLLGGALLIAYFGSGPLSLDARRTGPA